MKHPPIDNFAKKKKQNWQRRDEIFEEAMSAFNTYVKTATSYYNEKKDLVNRTNSNKKLVEENINADLKVILNNLNKKIDSSQITDGYEQELINTFRRINKENKRIVFTSLMEILNATL